MSTHSLGCTFMLLFKPLWPSFPSMFCRHGSVGGDIREFKSYRTTRVSDVVPRWWLALPQSQTYLLEKFPCWKTTLHVKYRRF